MNPVLAKYDSVVDQVMRDFDGPVRPKVLYHYTRDLAGFHGIVTSKCVWVRNALTFDDDTKELRHAEPLILEAADGLLRTVHGLARALLDEFIANFRQRRAAARPWTLQFYVASFSLAGDDEYLWHKYGGDGRGVCLGIDVLHGDEGEDVEGTGTALVPVEYDVDVQRRGVTKCFRSILERLTRLARGLNRGEVEHLATIAGSGLWRVAMHASATTKDAALYSAEREWRLILVTKWPNPALRTVSANDDARVVWPLRKSAATVSLASVTLGTELGNDAIMKAEAFLRECGYDRTTNKCPHLTVASSRPLDAGAFTGALLPTVGD